MVTGGQAFDVVENAANGTSLGTVLATDVDTVGTSQGWTIVSGNTDGIFAIDSATGELTVVDNSNLDFETTTSYVLGIKVEDGVNVSASTDHRDRCPGRERQSRSDRWATRMPEPTV